ncbi:SdpI family protein [Actinotignum urinale]|uniref:SdpI family protein n=1 Tax=Actinotignum urinale TaxID=190146 RepID=UPI000C8051AA|nr:SdpI family protein [Actinotignum urinale]WIK59287.1 SdpI family protein [Actinotignum urinale]
MFTVKIKLSVTALISTVLFAWLASVSRSGKLKRNIWAGYRTGTIMTNDETWYKAHLAAWKWTALTALVSAIASIGILSATNDSTLYAWSLAWIITLIIITMIGGAITAQRVATRLLKNSRNTNA